MNLEQREHQQAVLLEIRDIINNSDSDINIEPIMYHCEEWRTQPKPTMGIIRGKGDKGRKIGNLEMEDI